MLSKEGEHLKSAKLKNYQSLLIRMQNWKFIANTWIDLEKLSFGYDLTSGSNLSKLFLALRHFMLQVRPFSYFDRQFS